MCLTFSSLLPRPAPAIISNRHPNMIMTMIINFCFLPFQLSTQEEIVIISFLLFLQSFAYPVISIPSFSSFSPWRNSTRSGESAGTCLCLSKNTFGDHPISLIFFVKKQKKKSLKCGIEIDLVLVTKKDAGLLIRRGAINFRLHIAGRLFDTLDGVGHALSNCLCVSFVHFHRQKKISDQKKKTL